MSALKRYSLNGLLAAACDNDRLHEDDEEIPEWISQVCLLFGGKSMVEDLSMVLAKHCSDFEADKENHPWKNWFRPSGLHGSCAGLSQKVDGRFEG